jgi:hypothetical protein
MVLFGPIRVLKIGMRESMSRGKKIGREEMDMKMRGRRAKRGKREKEEKKRREEEEGGGDQEETKGEL